MPTTDQFVYDDILVLRGLLRQERIDRGQDVQRLTTERDKALTNCRVANGDADKWNRESCQMKRERDQALRDVEFARSATVSALRERDTAYAAQRTQRAERDKAEAERRRLSEIVTKQHPIIRDAEAKTADVGWRKNRLVEAIEKRGFVVRWQKDGTPQVLTKEQVAGRDKPKPSGSLFVNYLMQMERSLLAPPFHNPFYFLPGDTLTPAKPAAPQPAEDKVEKVEYKVEYKTYSPPWNDDSTAPQPTPTGQPYYERAMKAVYGYVVNPATWGAVTKGVIVRLDAALDGELTKHYSSYWNIGVNEACQCHACEIWNNRPWKRD